MLWLFATLTALASTPATTTVGELRMPYTPSDPSYDDYTAIIAFKGAGGLIWTSDAQGFTCRGDGDFVELTVARNTWPATVPRKVFCTEPGGKKVKVPVIIESSRDEAMFVSDGTLVIPRKKGAAARFTGEPPEADLIVQQGHTGSLNLRCEVEVGPKLVVRVESGAEDGEGVCTLKNKAGQPVRIPIHVVTLK